MFPEELVEKPVWRYFSQLCRIPHTSGNEAAVSAYIVKFAESRDLEVHSDPRGNVLIRKPGRGKTVILQAHMDMVGEKLPGSDHDFERDPIEPELDEGLLICRETTLGADNGIGVAVMLELLDSGGPGLPPLECLFTVDEERGLVGALTFPVEWITGTRLLNLDSEDLGVITIGCAGGRDLRLSLDGTQEEYDGPGLEISVSGLNGGHSGMEIDSDSANAIKLAARTCRQLQSHFGARLVSFSGGSKHNAIPREAVAVLALKDPAGAGRMCSLIRKDFQEEYRGIEGSIRLEHCETSPGKVLERGSSAAFIDMLLAVPHGVEKMSGTVDDLVETSSNLAVAETKDGRLDVLVSVRSALESAGAARADAIAALGRLAGAKVEVSEGYPGWTPDPSSALLETARDSCRKVLGIDPAVEAIHAGLECGIIGRRAGDLEMISIGPDIGDVHVPGEYVRVESVDSFMAFITDILERN